jgi:hypothetical protein
LAKRTAYGLNEIRKLINIETKFVDTGSSGSVDYSGTMLCVSQLAQGLTSTDRVGDSIKLQTIELRLLLAASATSTNTIVRVIMFRDLDGAGTAPTPANVLETVGSSHAPLSPYKFNRRDRFGLLFDEVVTLQSVLATGLSSTVIAWKVPHEGHVKYLGTTAASASDGKGSVYLLLVSDLTASNLPTFRSYARLEYTDD